MYVYGVRFTVYTVRHTLYDVQCTVYSVQRTVYGVMNNAYNVRYSGKRCWGEEAEVFEQRGAEEWRRRCFMALDSVPPVPRLI